MKFKLNKKIFFLVLLIVLIGAIPRGIELLNQNYLFGYDQGQFYLDVKKIVVDHKPTLIGTEVGGGGGFFQGPGWYYLLTIPFLLMGGDPYGGMILMFIIGIAAVVLAFYFSRKMFDTKTALVISLLTAISPALITHARFIWPPFPIPLLTVFLLFFLFNVLQKKGKYLAFFAASLGFMTHFETATAATLFISLLFFSPFLLIKKLVGVKDIFYAIGALIATQAFLIIFDIRHNFLNIKGIIGLLLGKGSFKYPFTNVLDSRWNIFKDNFITTFPGGNFLWPVLLLIIVVGLALFLIDKKKKSHEKWFVVFLTLNPLILFLIFLKYGGLMWQWWILELHIYYIFLVGILLVYLWKKYSKNMLSNVVPAFLGILFIFSLYQTFYFYKNDFNNYGGVHKIKGKTQAIDFIYKDAGKIPFNVLVFSPPIYIFPYEYLFWWYGQRKYGYIPGSKKEGTLYLLIEPDPQKPWSHKGWLETAINVGKVEKTVSLPSGFIIQKRFVEPGK